MQFVVKQNWVWIQQQRLSLEILDKFLTPRSFDFLISEMRIVENILIGCYESQGNNMCERLGVYFMNDGNIFHDWTFVFFIPSCLYICYFWFKKFTHLSIHENFTCLINTSQIWPHLTFLYPNRTFYIPLLWQLFHRSSVILKFEDFLGEEVLIFVIVRKQHRHLIKFIEERQHIYII